MTTRETFWFRDVKQFEFLEKTVLQKISNDVRAGKKSSFRIWSAACSSGQEPYSISMILLNHFPSLLQINPKPILASDISQDALDQAKSGQYDSFEMGRGLPPDYQRYIQNNQVNQRVIDCVEFKQCNLTQSFSHLGKFDLILIRNALIYFNEATKKDILTRMHKQLVQNGVLFLSSTERVNELDHLFERDKTGAYYHKKDDTSSSFNF
jgi:chemotaxis protein methyltransferase CheR